MSTLEIVGICIGSTCVLLPIIFNLVTGYYDALDEREKLPFYSNGDIDDYRSTGTFVLMFWPIAVPFGGIVLGLIAALEAFFVKLPRLIAERSTAKREAREIERAQEENRRALLVKRQAKPLDQGTYRIPPERCGECGRVK